MTRFKTFYLLFFTIICLVTLINLWTLQIPFLSILFGSLSLTLFSYNNGTLFIAKNTVQNTLSGFIITLAQTIVISTPLYYIYDFSDTRISLVYLILTLLHIFIILKTNYSNNNVSNLNHEIFNESLYKKLSRIYLQLFHIILIAYCLYLLFSSQFVHALRNPWNEISPYFILFYFIASIIYTIILLKSKNKTSQLIHSILHFGLTISVALVVYKLGYGFDPFIHRATEELIYTKGIVTPKPFYYLGQYLSIVFLSKLTLFPLFILNKIFIVLLFAIGIPSFYISQLKESKNALGIIPLLLIPLSAFIMTTPQGIANIFTLIVILTSMYKISFLRKSTLMILFTLASLFTHPLAGIPCLIFTSLYLLYQKSGFSMNYLNIIKKIAFILLVLISPFTLPLAFLVNQSGVLGIIPLFTQTFFSSHTFPALLNSISFSPLETIHKFNFFKDIAYTISSNIYYISLALTLISLIFLYKNKALKKYAIYFITFIILLLNYLFVSSFIEFDSIIVYERNDYARRIFYVSFYFLIPFLILLFTKIGKHIIAVSSKKFAFFTIYLIPILLTTSMYTAYPTEDGYRFNRGYNVSNSDIAAVHYIHQDAQRNNIQDYIVLANQTVSSASLQEFGFKNYYKTNNGEELFYYPIPTSSPLYETYISITENLPSIDKVESVKEIIPQTQTVYFVINKYWARSAEIISESKKISDDWTSLNNDEVYVFKYDL